MAPLNVPDNLGNILGRTTRTQIDSKEDLLGLVRGIARELGTEPASDSELSARVQIFVAKTKEFVGLPVKVRMLELYRQLENDQWQTYLASGVLKFSEFGTVWVELFNDLFSKEKVLLRDFTTSTHGSYQAGRYDFRDYSWMVGDAIRERRRSSEKQPTVCFLLLFERAEISALDAFRVTEDYLLDLLTIKFDDRRSTPPRHMWKKWKMSFDTPGGVQIRILNRNFADQALKEEDWQYLSSPFNVYGMDAASLSVFDSPNNGKPMPSIQVLFNQADVCKRAEVFDDVWNAASEFTQKCFRMIEEELVEQLGNGEFAARVVDLSPPEIRQLPPNQQEVTRDRWPVIGEKAPRANSGPWRVTLAGLFAAPSSWSLEDFLQEFGPPTTCDVDIHCVTRWSKFNMRFSGVPLVRVLEHYRPLEDARFLVMRSHSDRNHSTSLTLRDARKLDVLLATHVDDKPLEEQHGGPIRVVVPGRYFYKSLKWLDTLELSAADELGFWEANHGYHNVGNPWEEQRYIAANVNGRDLGRILASNDLSGQNLLSVEAPDHNFTDLKARDASLRNANFANANLSGADFSGANLSNASFKNSNLRDAKFGRSTSQAADLEGADFRGADLRGVIFDDASLFGVSFVSNDTDGAIIDETTSFSSASVASLEDVTEQIEYVRAKANLS